MTLTERAFEHDIHDIVTSRHAAVERDVRARPRKQRTDKG